MPDSKGWYTKEEVIATGLPYWIPQSKRWTDEPYSFAVLLSKSRCKALGCQILRNGNEHPSAFRLENATKGSDLHRFVPLYDRTDMYETLVSEKVKFYEYETMGKVDSECLE